MAKTNENIEYYLDPKNDRDYLQDLLLNIKEAYENERLITFKIVEAKENGFVVKVKGLFAYVGHKYFCWSYPTVEFWNHISATLVGNYFRGKIYSFSGDDPISIKIDATVHKFGTPHFIKAASYQGIIVRKVKYGFFVDLGVHFSWRFGSILGLIHRSNLKNEMDYENWKVGDKIRTFYYGLNKEGKSVLVNNPERAKWINGEMDALIGTIQKIKVVKNENGYLEFYVLDKYTAYFPLTKILYPDSKSAVKAYFKSLKNGDILDGEVIKINIRKGAFVLKLLSEFLIK